MDLKIKNIIAEIIYQIEEEFNIEISDEDCLKLKTINNVIDYVKGVLKQY